MPATAQRYYLGIDDLATARGADAALSFDGVSAARFGVVLQQALRSGELFARWRALQEDPEAVDASLGAVDAAARVVVTEAGHGARVTVTTALPHALLKQRLRLLIGSHWSLRDVRPA
jgi:hypothetical protein